MNEKELIKQLNDLPQEIEVKDQWQQIKQAIESPSVQQQNVEIVAKRSWKFPVAVAASVLMVSLLAVFMPKQDVNSELDLAQQKTLFSLQQANSQYYSALGNRMAQESAQLPKGINVTLKDLRNAQKSYLSELASSPNNADIFKRLIKSYQTERSLLRQLLS